MTTATELRDAYLRTWNETDAQRRAALLREHWTADAAYADPMAQVAGAAQLDALIAGVQQRFPGFRFVPTGMADGHGPYVRFAWTLGPEGAAEAPIAGSDVVELADGRIHRVIGFLDKVPG